MEIEHEPEERRFVARVEGGEARLEYAAPREGVIDLVHTFVPRAARGEGVGEALVERALDHARSEGLKVIATCPFVRAWLADHPGHEDLLAT